MAHRRSFTTFFTRILSNICTILKLRNSSMDFASFFFSLLATIMVSTTLTTLAAGQTTSSTNHHRHHHQHQHHHLQQQQQQQPHHSSNGSNNSSYQRLPTPATIGASPTVAADAQQRNYYAHNGVEHDCDNSNASNSNSGYQQQQQLNLSHALFSPSPPLDDQINLLFPKCRPKQQQQQQQQLSSSGNRQQHEDNADVNLNSANNTTVAAATAEITGSSSPIITSISTPSYYTSVNIITQSPPPHSTSSHSSESLSSVTPRISTNPFLCAPLTPPTPPAVTENGDDTDVDGILLVEDEGLHQPPHQQQLIEESVPQTAYPASFYYHTGDTRRGHSYTDMPRKRNSAISVNRQYHQQHALLNGSSNNIKNGTSSNSQNPFKENCWESPTPRASSLLHSPTEYHDEHQQKQQQEQQQQHHDQQHMHASARRAYHQQREQLAPQIYSIGQRQMQSQSQSQSQNLQPPHVLRSGRSPVTRNLSTASFSTHQRPSVSVSNPCAEGLTPLASHYLYGSKLSLDQHPTDWEPREQRKQRLREEREREREREQFLLEQQQQQDVDTARDNHLSHLASAQQQQQQQCKRQINSHGRDHVLINSNISTVSSYGVADNSGTWQRK